MNAAGIESAEVVRRKPVASRNEWKGTNARTAEASQPRYESVDALDMEKKFHEMQFITETSQSTMQRVLHENEAKSPLGNDFDSDSDSDFDSDTEQLVEIFYGKEAKACVESKNWLELEKIVTKALQRQLSRHSATVSSKEVYMKAHWKLWLGVALLRQNKAKECVDALESVPLASSSIKGSRRSLEQSTDTSNTDNFVSDEYLQSRIYLTYATALVSLGRLEEAKPKCQRAIKLGKRAVKQKEAPDFEDVIPWFVETENTANVAMELMVIILEKSGEGLDARLYKSLLPERYGPQHDLFRDLDPSKGQEAAEEKLQDQAPALSPRLNVDDYFDDFGVESKPAEDDPFKDDLLDLSKTTSMTAQARAEPKDLMKEQEALVDSVLKSIQVNYNEGTYSIKIKDVETTFPLMGLQRTLWPKVPKLPKGWEQRTSSLKRPYFVNHNTQSTTWDDPRFDIAAIRSSWRWFLLASPGVFN